MGNHKNVLGKGLASLLPGMALNPSVLTENRLKRDEGDQQNVDSSSTIPNRDRHPGIAIANIDDIQINPYQPRREFNEDQINELAQSILSNGIIQPLIVRKTTEGYQLIAGERRLRAAKKAGLKQVPIVIRRSTDREALELALIENIQRQDLNCVDEALAYFQLQQEFSLTQEEIAVRVGKDRATIANFLRLLRLPEEILRDLKEGRLSHGHGKALLAVKDPVTCMKIRNEVLNKGLSVRECEALIQRAETCKTETENTKNGKQSLEPSPIQQRFAQIEKDLVHRFSAKTEIRGNEKKGKIVIHYKTREDLDRIIEILSSAGRR